MQKIIILFGVSGSGKSLIGKKLSDNDLIGIPYQVIIGKRDLKDNIVQLKNRLNNETKKISPEEALNFLLEQTITDF